uniref:Family with sequence similarity 177 member A1 n=1 Tax=Paramormyrops kingsleyae TaxID=1676925 RepID=A0A3B3SC75_9TELE
SRTKDPNFRIRNSSLGVSSDPEPPTGKDFENVELGDQMRNPQQKSPRRTIYFAGGETMEEYSTDEEEEEPEKKDLIPTVDPAKLTWGPYFLFHMWRAAMSTVSVCDYFGEKMSSLLGITTPKYQYAIDEFYRIKKEEEEEAEENQLSEEAERHFNEKLSPEGKQPMTEQPESSASFVKVTFDVQEETHTSLEMNMVAAPIPS